ncbi:MAG: bifunctional riboflavin kinase/FAD synthetase [Planctomycetes bacterium]|nr:bifunctional riboflavin kinase/FAD synthetase [Planctomycetota bacterium]
MKVLRGLDDLALCRNGYVSIGNFDGVHLGHRSMIDVLKRCAGQHDCPAVIFTFDPHPVSFLRPTQTPPLLTTIDRKLELFKQTGVDAVLVYPTGPELLNLGPREFFDQIVLNALNARGLVEGPNFCFGRDRSGTNQTLAEFCRDAGRELQIVPLVTAGDALISSTEIRRLILEGHVREAARLLGNPYQVSGTIVRGAERGRTIGFPTANFSGIRTVLPRDGVYATRVRVDGTWYPAGVNVGPNPTFADQERKFEAHLLGFSGDLYGAQLALEFVDRIRDTRPFAGVAALQQQLAEDLRRVREVVSCVD